MVSISLNKIKIPWLFPDLEKNIFFPDFSLTAGNPGKATPLLSHPLPHPHSDIMLQSSVYEMWPHWIFAQCVTFASTAHRIYVTFASTPRDAWNVQDYHSGVRCDRSILHLAPVMTYFPGILIHYLDALFCFVWRSNPPGRDRWINIESTLNQPIYVDSLLIQCNLPAGCIHTVYILTVAKYRTYIQLLRFSSRDQLLDIFPSLACRFMEVFVLIFAHLK